MNKKELFKNFARMHPELVSYVKDGKMTWQSFYELYDIYGEDNKAWSPYLNSSSEVLSENITDKLKNIDDLNYLKQLDGYKNYLQKISNKKVEIYLYSIMTGELKEL